MTSGLQGEPWALAKDDKGWYSDNGNRKIGSENYSILQRKKSADPGMFPASITTVQILG